MFHIGIWMLVISGIPVILILIWMLSIARRRSARERIANRSKTGPDGGHTR